ncbi:alpha-(1-_3)-arabinofuranosyltransferase family protein [Streptomyces sp. NPDC058000]|uniref:alpha-(1->3)-arabinofuranosyltransferase domain-containing protein n=1 Tax=Streptomyces sp. NPDC058000 TaxID=3346299 RepID=UPI0036EE0143
MTQTLKMSPSPGAPDAGGTPATAPAPPPDAPRRRRWLLAFWAATLVAFLAPSPGKTTFETKLGVATDPWRFLADLGQLWHARAGFGGLADQYVGYAFPSLPYYGATHLVHLPVWLAERLWMSLIVTTAFWGALRLAERFRTGTPPTRLLGAACYALWPAFTLVVGSTSAAALPGALLPWVLLPLTDPRRTARTAAALSALLIPCMGGVNAASTLASLLPALLYLLSRTGPRRRALLSWWLPGVVLATAWWAIPLLLLGLHGENFMPFIEQADTTTGTMSATELLRGAGNWVGYLNFGKPWLPAGWTLTGNAVAVAGSALAAALGLAGLARRDLPERRWLLLTVLTIALITLAGYGGALGGPLHGPWQDWLNGWLRPFRNIYKFTPGLGLALALGLAHLLGAARWTRTGRRGTRLPTRRLPAAVTALLVLPALALPYLNGSVLQPGGFRQLPAYWQQTAGWLKDHTHGSRALVVPATAHGLFTWGSPIDDPLDVLAQSPWAQRDFVPFGTPGSRRALDAVEQALLTGAEVPGLRDYLHRAGLHDVVVRNDLDPDQIGYVPPQTVERTLEASGYRKVAAFGPLTTAGRIPAEAPLQVQGLYPRQRAVEIYRPQDVPEPGPVTAPAVADTAQLSGGPEALLQLSADPTLRNRATVLSGDRHPGIGTPPLQLTADGLRRADTRFGLVNSNTSYTYTADETNLPGSLQDPGRPPRQILPTSGTDHQTTAVLRGAASVTASSSGNWLFHLPQYDPVNAFDGNPETAWAEGSAGNPVGQWIRIAFTTPTTLPATLSVTPLPGDGLRAAPTAVRVQTDRGSADSPLRPDGSRQQIKAPPGKATWLQLTITGAQSPRSGLSGAGFTDISIPGVQVTRMLQLPTDAAKSDAPSETISLHRGTDPGGLSPVSAEVGLHRQFSTGRTAPDTVTGTALAVPGPALDRLLDKIAPEQKDRITATADSTGFGFGQSLSPRNLVDGDLTTAWIAGAKPTIHLRWPGKKKIDQIVLAAAGGISTRPEQIQLNSPYGAATAGVDENGLARFDPITTDRLDITISKVKELTLSNPVAGQALQLPVGLSEVYIPALDAYRTPRPDPGKRFSLPCGQGPMLAVDGILYATRASGAVRDLTDRRPLAVQPCGPAVTDGRLLLRAGQHRVEAGDQGPLALTDVTLSRGPETADSQSAVGARSSAPAHAATPAPARTATAKDWTGDHRTVTLGAGRAAYLQVHENANDGWHATLNGRELTPLRIDGWQQAFLVPASAGGTVELTYTPATLYHLGLIGGALGIALLLAAALIRRTPRTPPPAPQQPPAPSWVLGTLALTAVLAMAAGPYALIVAPLALLARLRPRALTPLAGTAMLAAGITAALGAGRPVAEHEGAFSTLAQALALLALTAAVITLPTPTPGTPTTTDGTGSAPTGTGVTGSPLTGTGVTGSALTGTGVTGTGVTPAGPADPAGTDAAPPAGASTGRPPLPRRGWEHLQENTGRPAEGPTGGPTDGPPGGPSGGPPKTPPPPRTAPPAPPPTAPPTGAAPPPDTAPQPHTAPPTGATRPPGTSRPPGALQPPTGQEDTPR